ncbi:MmcQ/YjbR family DNA-binding protein [Campylobacter majalis]|uniref:MmcQ/YjbR family DNA-binding protein n=1 Tax=Campylobacter majalis TaxID=2790656 RepID=UPI003D68966B
MLGEVEILEIFKQNFNTSPNYPFKKYPNFATFCNHKGKWFALMMKISAKKLNINSDNEILVLNLKTDMAQILIDHKQIYPAYHMNKIHWISVKIDDKIDKDFLIDLIDTSLQLSL